MPVDLQPINENSEFYRIPSWSPNVRVIEKLRKNPVKSKVPDKRINLLCSRMEYRCSVLNVKL
jgi:hypothetical protein